MLFKKYKNKSVLITGNTGFKGSWLSVWLNKLGAKVYGFSSDLPTTPSNYKVCGLDNITDTVFADIRDLDSLTGAIKDSQPDYIFHLAAQSLVKKSYESPIDTFSTNAFGSVNILEASRILDKEVSIVMITSDKAYDNVEWKWGYRENDILGGKDPYSASKGMAELAIRSYFESFMSKTHRLGITRAGNVIGGGDWAQDRIIPDCVRSWSSKRTVEIRNPGATRPWQHVLEPLGGYLTLGALLEVNENINGQAYNFGPPADQNHSVSELISEMQKHWRNVDWKDISNNEKYHEAGLLKLNCDKALFDLNWNPTLSFNETVRFTAEWYKAFYDAETKDMLEFSNNQIDEYVNIAREKNISWAR